MREVQLAKAAVRAGLETLLLRFGARCEDLRAVYLAGGFGHALDAQSAAQIGLIPRALLPKVRAVGNASLLGATQALTEPGARERAARIAAAAREISLSEDADFQSLYVEHMLFAEES